MANLPLSQALALGWFGKGLMKTATTAINEEYKPKITRLEQLLQTTKAEHVEEIRETNQRLQSVRNELNTDVIDGALSAGNGYVLEDRRLKLFSRRPTKDLTIQALIDRVGMDEVIRKLRPGFSDLPKDLSRAQFETAVAMQRVKDDQAKKEGAKIQNPTLFYPGVGKIPGIRLSANKSSISDYVIYQIPTKDEQTALGQKYETDSKNSATLLAATARAKIARDKVAALKAQKAQEAQRAAKIAAKLKAVEALGEYKNIADARNLQRTGFATFKNNSLAGYVKQNAPAAPATAGATGAGAAAEEEGKDAAEQLRILSIKRQKAATKYQEDIEYLKRIQQDVIEGYYSEEVIKRGYTTAAKTPVEIILKLFQSIAEYEQTIQPKDMASDYGPLFRVDRNTNKGIISMPRCLLTINPSEKFNPKLYEPNYVAYLLSVDEIKRLQTECIYDPDKLYYLTKGGAAKVVQADIISRMMRIVNYERLIPIEKMHPDRRPSSLTPLLTVAAVAPAATAAAKPVAAPAAAAEPVAAPAGIPTLKEKIKQAQDDPNINMDEYDEYISNIEQLRQIQDDLKAGYYTPEKMAKLASEKNPGPNYMIGNIRKKIQEYEKKITPNRVLSSSLGNLVYYSAPPPPTTSKAKPGKKKK